MKFSNYLRALAFVSAVLFSQGVSAPYVQAHPHAWIVMNATVQFNDAGLATGLYLEWKFGENYSKIAVEGLDANKDGYYDSAELRPVTKGNVESLQEYNYFAYVKSNGKKVSFKTVTEYSEYYTNKHLTMSFTIPFKTPVDPRKQDLQFKVYDPTFYIAMDFQKTNPVSASGKIPKRCKIALKPFSTDKEIDKKRNELAGKGKDWKPGPQEDFGALFAQAVAVVCTEKTALK